MYTGGILIGTTISALLATVHTLPQKPGGYDQTPTKSGNYEIYYCLFFTPSIISSLSIIWTSLQAALQVLHEAGPSASPAHPAYKAFLAGVDPTRVLNLLQDIAEGSNINVDGSPHAPSLACLRPGIPYYEHCSGRIRAFYLRPSEFISLCPTFFTTSATPSNKTCGLRDNTIGYNQPYILLHELIHLYFRTRVPSNETYGAGDCTALPPAQAANNPSNYVYFVANVALGCTTFPSPPEPSSGRNTLETDDGNGDGSSFEANVT